MQPTDYKEHLPFNRKAKQHKEKTIVGTEFDSERHEREDFIFKSDNVHSQDPS